MSAPFKLPSLMSLVVRLLFLTSLVVTDPSLMSLPVMSCAPTAVPAPKSSAMTAHMAMLVGLGGLIRMSTPLLACPAQRWARFEARSECAEPMAWIERHRRSSCAPRTPSAFGAFVFRAAEVL